MLIFDQLKRNDRYLRALTWGVLAGMSVLVAGLYYVQIVGARYYTENQISQSFRTVRIPAARGKILDRHGRVLAENRPTFTAGLYLEELRDLFKGEWRRSRPRQRLSTSERPALESQSRYRVVSNIVYQLSLALNQPIGMDYDTFNKHYHSQLALPLPLLSNLDPNQVARFQEQPFRAPGLDLVVQPFRFYPCSNSAAHVVGYLTRDDSSAKDEDAFFNYRMPDYRGRIGIERTFDEELRGRAGVKSMLVNSMGYRQSETVWAQAEPGKNVVLTLDLTVQQTAERALLEAAPYTHTRRVLGAAVVMDPWTGDIIAMASVPSFDPNEFIPFITPENYAKFTDDVVRLESNRAIHENYLPGSIFKIVTGLACLETGLNPATTIFNPGYIRLPGGRYINDLAMEGEYDFERAFLKSSNFYFITNGIKAGVETIVALGKRFHLGELSGLPTGQEVPGHFPTLDDVQRGWSIGDTANLCMGQGVVDVTLLQMAVMTAAIANGGKVLFPRLVDRLEPAQRHSLEENIVFPSGRVRNTLGVQPRSLQIVRDAMLADVVHEGGTGRAAGVIGMNVCGKTGTAQVQKRTKDGRPYIDQTTWFASYAPYEQPRYVVVVMVESGTSGGGTCAPVAKKIYETLLALSAAPAAQVARQP